MARFTIATIRREMREQAPHIARQYSALWDEFVVDALTRIERQHRDRMSDQVFDEMFDYGVAQVRKHGLPCSHQHLGTVDNPTK